MGQVGIYLILIISNHVNNSVNAMSFHSLNEEDCWLRCIVKVCRRDGNCVSTAHISFLHSTLLLDISPFPAVLPATQLTQVFSLICLQIQIQYCPYINFKNYRILELERTSHCLSFELLICTSCWNLPIAHFKATMLETIKVNCFQLSLKQKV